MSAGRSLQGGGTGAGFGVEFGQNGGAGGFGSAGIVVTQKVA